MLRRAGKNGTNTRVGEAAAQPEVPDRSPIGAGRVHLPAPLRFPPAVLDQTVAAVAAVSRRRLSALDVSADRSMVTLQEPSASA